MAKTKVIKQEKPSKSICRLCFMEREHYESIFEDDHADLAEWIGNLTSLKLVNVPNAPASLCLECKTTLEDFESFREMCHTNDRAFQESFFQNDSQAKETADPLDFPIERTIKVERSESQETGISKEKCSIASIYPEVENDDITEEFEDIKIEIEENPLDCEEKADQPIQCEICSKSFTTKWKLRSHMVNHNKKHVCSFCNKAFKSSNALKYHIRTHTGERPFKCEKCDKSFKHKHTLNLHELSFHGGKKVQPMQCEICSKSFTTKKKFRLHMSHHNKKHFCSYCNKAFRSSTDLKIHIRAHTGERPFKCEKCDKSYKSKQALYLHALSFHGRITEEFKDIKNSPKKEQPIQCEICSKSFTLMWKLRSHMIDHNKQHVCSYCNKAFRTPSHLKVHIRTHTGERPFKCEWCDKSYRYKKDLYSHTLSFHGGVMF